MDLTVKPLMSWADSAHMYKEHKQDKFNIDGEEFSTHDLVNELDVGLDESEHKTLQGLYDKGQADDLFKKCMAATGNNKEEAMAMMKTVITQIDTGTSVDDVKKNLDQKIEARNGNQDSDIG